MDQPTFIIITMVFEVKGHITQIKCLRYEARTNHEIFSFPITGGQNCFFLNENNIAVHYLGRVKLLTSFHTPLESKFNYQRLLRLSFVTESTSTVTTWCILTHARRVHANSVSRHLEMPKIYMFLYYFYQ